MDEESVSNVGAENEEDEISVYTDTNAGDEYGEKFTPTTEFEPGKEEETQGAEEISKGETKETTEEEKPEDKTEEKTETDEKVDAEAVAAEEEGEGEGEGEGEKSETKARTESTESDRVKHKKVKRHSKRKSGSQIRFRGEQTRVSGDFKALSEDFVGQVRKSVSIESFRDEEEEEEEEYEEEEIVEAEPEPIDRESYYNVYRELMPQKNFQRMKNNVLQRKMAEYYKKKKMEHVLREVDNVSENQYKYDRKLKEFNELKNLDKRERASISAELCDLRNQKKELRIRFEENFKALQIREKETGTGLINTKTGKEIPEKLIERLLRRQKLKTKEVAIIRLTCIKIRKRVAEKKLELYALETIGENLHLIDYEQMKIVNQNHIDKIEERDEELIKLRVKAKGAIQCLAQLREKSVALQYDLLNLNERHEEIDLEVNDSRERRNSYKTERDRYRLETEKLQQRAGILTKPKLLCDMEDSIKELKTRSEELDRLKKENSDLKNNISAIKKNIKFQSQKMKTEKKPAAIKKIKSINQRIYKGRPTLIYPELPNSDWDNLY